MLSESLRTLIVPAAMFASTACSSQAATNYPGQALASLSGTVVTASSPSTGQVDAALVWANVQFSASADFVKSVSWVGESTPVAGQFPASFTLNVYEPPPDSVLIGCPDSSAHIAVAFIVAVPAGPNVTGDDIGQSLVGEAENFMVLYLDTDQPSGWSCLPNLGFAFAPTKGFHLLSAVTNSIQPRAEGACYPAFVESSLGLGTPITMDLWNGPTSLSNLSYSCAYHDCTSACESKARGCGAPSDKATKDCNQACYRSETPPTTAQVACVESSACEALEVSFQGTGTICGIGGSVGGVTAVQLDAGLPDAAAAMTGAKP